MFDSIINQFPGCAGAVKLRTVGLLAVAVGVLLSVFASNALATRVSVDNAPKQNVEALIKQARKNAPRYEGMGVSPAEAGLKRVARPRGNQRSGGVHAATRVGCQTTWYLGLRCELAFDARTTGGLWRTLEPYTKFPYNIIGGYVVSNAIGAACGSVTFGTGYVICKGAAQIYANRFMGELSWAGTHNDCLVIKASLVPYPPYVALTPWDITTSSVGGSSRACQYT